MNQYVVLVLSAIRVAGYFISKNQNQILQQILHRLTTCLMRRPAPDIFHRKIEL